MTSKKQYQIFTVTINDWVLYDPSFSKKYDSFFPLSCTFFNSRASDVVTNFDFRLLIGLIKEAHRLRKGTLKVDERLWKGNGKVLERSLSSLQEYQILTYSKDPLNKEINKEIKHSAKALLDLPQRQLAINQKKVPVGNKLKSEIEELYLAHYPIKKGKSSGVAKLSKDIKTDEDLANLKIAILVYSNSITDPKYTKHFSTFASEWRDWLDPEAGKVKLSSTPKREEVVL